MTGEKLQVDMTTHQGHAELWIVKQENRGFLTKSTQLRKGVMFVGQMSLQTLLNQHEGSYG